MFEKCAIAKTRTPHVALSEMIFGGNEMHRNTFPARYSNARLNHCDAYFRIHDNEKSTLFKAASPLEVSVLRKLKFLQNRTPSFARLEVLVKRERRSLRTAIKRRHHSFLLVFANTLLEEVRLSLKADELHPVEGVCRVVQLRMSQRRE